MATILSAQQKLWNIKVLMVLVPQVCYHSSLRIRRYLLWAASEIDSKVIFMGHEIVKLL
jgi:hypothetical protein